MSKRVNGKQKGKVGELKAVHLWRAVGFDKAARVHDQSEAGHGQPDISGVPVWCEVKRWSLKSAYPAHYAQAWNQAARDMSIACEKELIPDLLPILVMVKVDRRQWECLADSDLLAEIEFRGDFGEFRWFRHDDLAWPKDIFLCPWRLIAPYIQSKFGEKERAA